MNMRRKYPISGATLLSVVLAFLMTFSPLHSDAIGPDFADPCEGDPRSCCVEVPGQSQCGDDGTGNGDGDGGSSIPYAEDVLKLKQERDNALKQLKEVQDSLKQWQDAWKRWDDALDKWKAAYNSLNRQLLEAEKKIKELEAKKPIDQGSKTPSESALTNLILSDFWGSKAVVNHESKSGDFVVDPRKFVTFEFYKLAQDKKKKLIEFQQKLKKEITKLQGFQTDQMKYRQEFEKLRAEAVSFTLADIMATIPAPRIFNGIAKKYPNLITKSALAKFTTAYEGILTPASLYDTLSEENNLSRVRKTLGSAKSAREALLTINLSRLPDNDEGKKWLTGMGKSLDVFTKVLNFTLEQRTKEEPPPLSEWVKLGAETTAIFYLPMSVGLSIENFSERVGTLVITNKAMASLSNALSQNWNAERHLEQKIEQANLFINELDRQIQAYESLHPSAPINLR